MAAATMPDAGGASLAAYQKLWAVSDNAKGANTVQQGALPASSIPAVTVTSAPSVTTPSDDLANLAVGSAGTEGAQKATISQDDSDDADQEPLHSSVMKLMDVVEVHTETGEVITTKARRLRQAKPRKTNDYSLILRRVLDHRGRTVSANLEIRSLFLKNMCKEVLQDFDRLNLDGELIKIPMPWYALYYKQDEIRERRDKEQSAAGRHELDLLIEFIDLRLGQTRRDAERHIKQNKITSELAWTLYPPGELVLFMPQGSVPAQCWKVLGCETVQSQQGPMLILRVVAVVWNGRRFGTLKRQMAFPLPGGGGSYPVTDIRAYPLKFHPESAALRADLIARGRKYASIIRRAHMAYDGVMVTQDPIEKDSLSVHYKGRVIIDYGQFVRNSPDRAFVLDGDFGVDITEDIIPCSCGDRSCRLAHNKASEEGKTEDAKVKPDEESLDDDELLRCPGYAQGFALRDKVWAEFRVDLLSEIEWNEKAYQRLEMDEELKEVIQALVESHRKHNIENPPDFDDIIAGKGLGLVFLLQGHPGLGKTLTAESVAEQSKKPLYGITCGELGTTVAEMEQALERAFRTAKEWGAIILLDEADVFMSKRTADNFEKNAFVSVFLRLLEYYQGIMFLTTNRSEDFDPAFISRIHLVVDFKALDEAKRARIWKNISAGIRKDDTLTDAAFDNIAKDFQINGREIKNMLRIAWSLAKHDADGTKKDPILTLKHLRTVARVGIREGIKRTDPV